MSCSDISVVPMAADKSHIDETNTSISSTSSLKLFKGEEKKTPLRPPQGYFILFFCNLYL